MKMNLVRTVVCYLLFLLLVVIAVLRIIDLQFIHTPDLTKTRKTNIEEVVPSKRGSILSTDGRFMAFTVQEYKVYLDCPQPHDTVIRKELPALCDSLSSMFKERSSKQYSDIIKKGRIDSNKFLCLTPRRVSYQEMKRICSFPVLRRGKFKGGCAVSSFNVRKYPYGTLAYRALGRIEAGKDDKTGIEESCDSLLRGQDGIRTIRKTEHNRWILDPEGRNISPIDGTDVRSTIDIDIQEIAENAMRRTLAKSDDIQYGTVIVMETATGRIRAMVNLNRDEKTGEYHETFNWALAGTGEPGSVFKLATLTLLLDEGKTTLSHVMSPAPRVIKCGNAKPMEDPYLRPDKYPTISVLRGFEISSNNVFRKLAWDNYSDKPTEFVDKLNDQVKISYNFDFDIKGLGRAHIKHPSEKDSHGRKTWSDSDLPQIAMGYTSRLAPLHTINFYNAIANGGMMVRPRLIESFEKDGMVVKEFKVEEIGRVCSEKTAKELHKALRSVVVNGTGEVVFKNCKVAIAGKTGTARVAYGKGGKLKQHQATFAGFFPYENPKYTAIAVLYSNPSNKNYYGATWGGPVVREIAEELYAIHPEWNEQMEKRASLPKAEGNSSLREMINLYEKEGYKVKLQGHGKVVSHQIDSLGETVTLIMQ